MHLQKETIEEITLAFAEMKSVKDFIALLNIAKSKLFEEDVPEFTLQEISWFSNHKLGGERFIKFSIRKKSGSVRMIYAPVSRLKLLQKIILIIFQCIYKPHDSAKGFVIGSSIVDNAILHIKKRYVYNIDLKDFFSSIDQARVWKCLQLKPFNLIGGDNIEIKYTVASFKDAIESIEPTHFRIVKSTKWHYLHLISKDNQKESYVTFKIDHETDVSSIPGEKLIEHLINNHEIIIAESNNRSWYTIKKKGTYQNQRSLKSSGRLNIANMIAAICCIDMDVERINNDHEWTIVNRSVLPQGAPTSPFISNMICQRLDYLLSGVSKRFGLDYSRYADDITFSSNHNVYQPDGDFIKELNRIVLNQGFQIKSSKTRLQKEGFKKEVTGLLVNEKVNVQKRYIKQLRMWLHYWEIYGYSKAYTYFIKDYLHDKGHVKKGMPDLSNVISGKLDYLKMIKGIEDQTYIKLSSRFNKLIGSKNPIDHLLSLWEQQGIEFAMESYYGNKKSYE